MAVGWWCGLAFAVYCLRVERGVVVVKWPWT
jgi:hypothetical protein